MIAEDLAVRERPDTFDVSTGPRDVRGQPSPRAESSDIGLGWRLILVFVGFLVASIGWVLVMTIILSFIGLPVFMFGLALMQAQER
jgi:hypothetical protein